MTYCMSSFYIIHVILAYSHTHVITRLNGCKYVIECIGGRVHGIIDLCW